MKCVSWVVDYSQPFRHMPCIFEARTAVGINIHEVFKFTDIALFERNMQILPESLWPLD